MKKIILSAVVAAAAIFGAYSASQNSNEVAFLGLLDSNAEMLAEGEIPGNGGGSYYPRSQTPTQLCTRESMSASSNKNSTAGDHDRGGSGSVGIKEWASGEYHNTRSDSSYNYHSDTTRVAEYSYTLVFPCVGDSGQTCSPEIIKIG